ncbi:hypothetical protein VTJ49DRAFT_7183 [Mycothermus thermophilus]|uniref:Uncharacterized protein n=1 Tax=Humicola insolens TaxID=85995 RepID=A0ABR3VPZ6_HUMIN
MPMGNMMMPPGMMAPGMMPMGFPGYPVAVPEPTTVKKPAAKAPSAPQTPPTDMTKGPMIFRLLPVIFSFVAFILALLALFAGNKPGILEGYDILTVNISYLRTNQSGPEALLFLRNECNGSGILTQLCEDMKAAAGIADPEPVQPHNGTRPVVLLNETKSHSDDAANNALPARDQRQHPDFYALYPLAVCEGVFHKSGARINTGCHSLFSTDTSATIPALLVDALNRHKDNDKHDGNDNKSTTIADPLPGALSATLTGLNPLCKAIGFMLSVATGLTCLTLITSVCVVTLSSKTEPGGSTSYTWGVWTNLALCGFAFFFLVLAGLVGAAGGQMNEGNVNHQGKDVDVSAVAGTEWLTLEWVAAGVMVVVLAYWGIRAVRLRKAKKAEAARVAAEQEAEELEDMPRVMMPGVAGMRMAYA